MRPPYGVHTLSFFWPGKPALHCSRPIWRTPRLDPDSQNIKIEHFAFRVDRFNFDVAKTKYEELGLTYTFKDHHYYHSLYTKDPDGHTVELTMLNVDEKSFLG